MNSDILERARKVKLLLMDCDGVLTDGKLYYTENGETMKVFDVRDGQGIVAWHEAGFTSGIITGRTSNIVTVRARDLGIRFVRLGSKNKLSDFTEIIDELGFDVSEVAYVGDDLPDIDLMKVVGFAATVSDANDQLKRIAHFVTRSAGGRGAIREICDTLINAKY